MLNGLRDIDWSELGHPLLPNWIEALDSLDLTIRTEAYNNIYDANLDDLSRSSPYFVHFLIELLGNDVQEKNSILLLLMQISYSARSVVERNYKTLELASKTLQVMTEGIDLFLSLLSITEYQYYDLELLSRLNDQSSQIIPYLLVMIENPETSNTLRPLIKRVIDDLSNK